MGERTLGRACVGTHAETSVGITDPEGEFVRPGQPCQFRDVDRYDGRIGETGVGLQPAFYGGAACT